MTTHYKFLDGRGSPFRIEPRGGDWGVITKSDDGYGEEEVATITNCDAEWLAARIFQLMSGPDAMSFPKNLGIGIIVSSNAVNEWIEPDDRRTAVMLCLIRHASGDWGCVDDVHRDANIQSTVEGKGPILSEFEVDGRSLYIGTNDNIDGQLSTVVFFKEESGTECIGVQWA